MKRDTARYAGDTRYEIITTRQTGGLLGGYKPLLLGQRLKALAFILGYGKFDFPQLHSSHIAFDSSLPHKGVLVLLHVNP